MIPEGLVSYIPLKIEVEKPLTAAYPVRVRKLMRKTLTMEARQYLSSLHIESMNEIFTVSLLFDFWMNRMILFA